MKGSKILNMSRLFLLLLLLSGFFGGVWGAHESGFSLTVYKVTNISETKPGLLHSLEEPLTSEQMKERKVKGVSGSTIGVFLVGEARKENLDLMTTEALKEKYTSFTKVTDEDGKAVFSSLPKGTWYIRDLTEEDPYVSLTSLVSLPYVDGEKVVKDLHVSLKVYKPEEPGRKFKKTDDKNHPLAGATFLVKKRVKNKDGKDVLVTVKKGGRDYTVTSGKDGSFTVRLPKGDYWLVESTPPKAGGFVYKILKTSYAFSITDDSIEDAPVTIINIPGEEIPKKPDEPDKPREPKKEKPPKKETPPKKDTPKKESPKKENPKKETPKKKIPPRPSIRIPKTGDVQIFLMVIGGFNLFAVGAYNYYVEDKKKK